MKQLKDRVAVITGAASGIGRALSLELAEAGCHLALVDKNTEALEITKQKITTPGVRVSTHQVDVSSLPQMKELVEAVLAEHGQVNILINNAGVASVGSLEDETLDNYDWLVGINFWGVVYGCKLFLPHLKRAQEAHIVNLSSLFGLTGIPTQTAYCATKFAVRGFSESLWLELKPHGIGVTSVHPGMIATNIVAQGRMSKNEEGARSRTVDTFARRGMPPERAAKIIIKAIRCGKQRQMVGAEAYIADWLRRAAPSLSLHAVSLGHRLFERYMK